MKVLLKYFLTVLFLALVVWAGFIFYQSFSKPQTQLPPKANIQVVSASTTPATGGTLSLGMPYLVSYTIKCQAAGIEWVGYYVRDDGATTTDVNKIRGTCRDGVNTQNFGFSATIVAVAPLYQFGAGHSVVVRVAELGSDGQLLPALDREIVNWFIE